MDRFDMFGRFPEDVVPGYMERIKTRQTGNDRKFATKEIFWEEFFNFIWTVVRMEVDSQTQVIANRFRNDYDRVENKIIEAISNLKYQVQENNRYIDESSRLIDWVIKLTKPNKKSTKEKTKK